MKVLLTLSRGIFGLDRAEENEEEEECDKTKEE